MRSGLERLTYAIIIIVVATITAWLMALLLHLHPVDFPALSMSVPMHIILRLVFRFCGVFGFSKMCIRARIRTDAWHIVQMR